MEQPQINSNVTANSEKDQFTLLQRKFLMGKFQKLIFSPELTDFYTLFHGSIDGDDTTFVCRGELRAAKGPAPLKYKARIHVWFYTLPGRARHDQSCMQLCHVQLSYDCNATSWYELHEQGQQMELFT